MRITDVKMTNRGPDTELSAEIGGHRLWYRVPSEYRLSQTGDPFLAAGFFPATALGETLEIERNVTISPKLKDGISKLQVIFNSWHPSLKKFEVVGKEGVSKSSNSGVASFFSGGTGVVFPSQSVTLKA